MTESEKPEVTMERGNYKEGMSVNSSLQAIYGHAFI